MLTEVKTIFDDGWFWRSGLGASGKYVAWCKRKPFIDAGSLGPLEEPDDHDVWFEFGATREEAIKRLRGTLNGTFSPFASNTIISIQ